MIDLVFMGSAEASCTVLRALLGMSGVRVRGVVTQPDRPSGRHRRLAPCIARCLAERVALPVITPERVNSKEAVAALEAWRPDVIVVVAYGQFLGRRLLGLPTRSCLNVHLSLLPELRGAAPVQWALLNGMRETGVTVMRMDAGMDSGDILAQAREKVLLEDTAESLQARLAMLGAELLVDVLPEWCAGRVVPRPQDAAAATFAPKLGKADGFLDWRCPAEELVRRVRAMYPWPCAFIFLADAHGTPRRLRVLDAGVHRLPEHTGAAPGSLVCADTHQGLCIAAGRDALYLRQVQPEGGRPMSALEYLRGHPLSVAAKTDGCYTTAP